jgi:hypothetical protein
MANRDLLDPYDDEDGAVRISRTKAQYAADLEIGDLKWLMSNKRGRRFIFTLLERAGVWRLSFNTNALTMAFAEGTRNEGLRLMAQLTEHCLDRYSEMLKEQQDG